MTLNWLFILVVIILLVNVIRGFRRGMAGILYSLGATILALILTASFTPNAYDYIKEETAVYETVQTAIEESLSNAVTGTESSSDTTDSEVKKTDDEESDARLQLSEAGVALPKILNDTILGSGGSLADEVLEETGVYATVSERIAGWIVYDLCFIVVFVLVRMGLRIAYLVVRGIFKLPVLKTVNRFVGVLAGGVEGLLLVWIILLAVVALGVTLFGYSAARCIRSSGFLEALYDCNPLFYLVKNILTQ